MTRALAWGLIAVSLLAAGPILAGRATLEQPNRSVELALDLEEARVLARTVGLAVEDLLAQLAGTGLTSLAVKEATPLSLAETGRLSMVSGTELARRVRTGRWRHEFLVDLVAGGAILPTHTYLVVDDAETAAWLAASLELRLDRVTWHAGEGLHLLGVAGGPERVEKLELGMDARDLALARQAGLALMPRFANYRGVTAEDIDEAFRTALAAGRVKTVVFTGYEVMGYPDRLAATARNLTQAGITLGLVETPVQRAFIRQDGHQELAAWTGYGVARVYSIARREMDKHLNPPRAIEMWVRAVKERNIRVLYLRPFLRPVAGFDDWDLLDLNQTYFRGLAAELSMAGFEPGPAEPFRPRRVTPWAAGLAGVGVVGGLLLLVGEFIDPGPRWGPAGAFLGIAGAAALLAVRSGLAIKGLALGSALVFPMLAVAVLVRRWAGRPGRGSALVPALVDLALASGLSLLGGLLVASVMGDIRFLLELDYFRGVKLAALGPPAVGVLAYLRHFPPGGQLRPDGLRGLGGSIRAMLRERVTIQHLVILALGAGVVFLYLGRTGHEAGIPVGDWEVQLRSWLERALYARPRIKEFLIGHPAVLLGGLAARRGYRAFLLPAAVLTAVGQASLVNSFEHLRTPVVLSLLRTANGLIVGALVGAALLVLTDLALRRLERWGLPGRSPR